MSSFFSCRRLITALHEAHKADVIDNLCRVASLADALHTNNTLKTLSIDGNLGRNSGLVTHLPKHLKISVI